MEQPNHDSNRVKNQSLEESTAFAVMSHLTQVLKDSEASTSSVYLPVENFFLAMINRLLEHDEFVKAVATEVVKVAGKSRNEKDFYSLKEVAEKLNFNPKYFSRICEAKFGLQKIYIANEVNFRADQVDHLIADLKGELLHSKVA